MGDRSPPIRISDEARAAHDAAVARGRSGYLDPTTGLFTFTARYLSDRGYCCGSGCRHCPYPPTDSVGDPDSGSRP